jgi:hypothetical protein
VRHKDWDAVGDLPGTRIERRQVEKGRYEFVDERGGVLADSVDERAVGLAGVVEQTKGTIFSNGTETYAFSKAGLERSGVLVVPWPSRRPKKGRHWIDMPDGRSMEIWLKYYSNAPKWSVLKILDESGESLVTVRWKVAGTRPWDVVGLNPKAMRRGEAVIAPGKVLPTERVPFVEYAFTLLWNATVNKGAVVPWK